MLRIGSSLVQLQWLAAFRRVRRVPHVVAVAAVFLGALYLLNLWLVVPTLSELLQRPFQQAEENHGAGPFFLALVHLVSSLLPAGAYFSQASSILDNSIPLRIVHQRARSPIAVSITLLAECLAMMVLVEVILFPLIWQPFLASLETQELARLIGFRLLTYAAILAMIALMLALRHRHRGVGGSILTLWLAVIGYYSLLFAAGGWVSRAIVSSDGDSWVVRALGLLNTLATGESTLARLGAHVFLWGIVLPLASLGLGRVLHRYGI